jgi:hypothetical protein
MVPFLLRAAFLVHDMSRLAQIYPASEERDQRGEYKAGERNPIQFQGQYLGKEAGCITTGISTTIERCALQNG